MAQIRERIKKNGKKSYFVRIRMKGKPEATASFERLTDARLWASSTETEIREGRYTKSTEAQRHTLSDLVDRYIRDVLPRKPKIRAEYTLQLKWWANQIGDVLLSDLTPSLISEHRDLLCCKITNRKSIISNSRVNRYMSALSSTISTAVREWEWMEDNPLRKISKLKEPRGRVRYLTNEERESLLTACKESHNTDLYLTVILAISTGGRRAEIWGLRWKCVDLKNGFITFEETKNDEPRSVPLAGHAFELMMERSKVPRIDTDLVFPSPKNPQNRFDFRRPFQIALKDAQIEDFRWHDLRHCAASYLVMAGVDMRTVAEILGHKTLQMTQRYAHLSPEHLKDAVAKMNNKIFG
ncbi:MAG: site-specific integrase [SAR324 cluster bacterium]|nr:site-specific integrase [SAR324 cluster bacterium]